MHWRATISLLPFNVVTPAESRLVRKTVENMVRAGELEARGFVRVSGSNRPMAIYTQRMHVGCNAGGFELHQAMSAWGNAIRRGGK